MLHTLAFFNISPGTVIVLAFVGLLLYGRDLPTIARNVAKQYIKYKKMFSDATADIQREMEKAAQVIEDEKRKIQKQIEDEKREIEEGLNADMPKLSELDTQAATPVSEESPPPHADTSSNGSNGSSAPVTPAKPSADPLALDVPAPSGLSHRATDPALSTTAKVAALDSLKSVPPPSKIPPPIG